MYRVQWAGLALNQLTAIWTEGDSNIRRLITSAVGQIDRQLADNPSECGESRSGPDRILFSAPLGIIFNVGADHRIVRVLRVWLVRQRRK
jgi:hypothetical protein